MIPNLGSMWRIPPPNSSSGSSSTSARIATALLPIAAPRLPAGPGPPGGRLLRLIARAGNQGDEIVGVDIGGSQLGDSECVCGLGMLQLFVMYCLGWRGSPPAVINPAVYRDGGQRAERDRALWGEKV